MNRRASGGVKWWRRCLIRGAEIAHGTRIGVLWYSDGCMGSVMITTGNERDIGAMSREGEITGPRQPEHDRDACIWRSDAPEQAALVECGRE